MRSRLVWSIFSLGTLLVLIGLAWISTVVLKLERSGDDARRESIHQDNVRVALWRLDSWFSPFLVQENTRPYFEYLPYYSLQQAYGGHLSPTDESDVLSPSPLLVMDSDILALHFQIDPDGVVTSPQVPDGEFRQLAASTLTDEDTIKQKAALLADIRERINPADLLAALTTAEQQTRLDESWIAEIESRPEEQVDENTEDPKLQTLAKQKEYSQRAQGISNAYQTEQTTGGSWQINAVQQRWQPSQSDAPLDVVMCEGVSVITEPIQPTSDTQVGPLLPVWVETDEEPMPVLLRQVNVGENSFVQGVLLDWDVLSEKLLAEASDLVPEAQLQPVLGSERNFDEADFLASLPVALIAPLPEATTRATLTTERLVLILVWIAAIAALAAAGATIAASMAFARKRSRFASSVTHELRTPLTTFQMYSEMLADGMVKDDAKRKKYLDTLKGESKRLSALVENVLTWSRVEAGRVERRTIETTANDLVSILDPILQLRCSESGVEFSIENSIESTETFLVDRDILERILFNLVDNACKYGSTASTPCVTLGISRVNGSLRCTVADNGTGITADRRRSIFRPFEQGKVNEDASADGQKAMPGVGLGLALCRELAHVLGGDLRLIERAGEGATFELEIPC